MSKRLVEFPKVNDGDLITIDLVKGNSYLARCCDCGLVHRLIFDTQDNGRVVRFTVAREVICPTTPTAKAGRFDLMSKRPLRE